MRELLAALEVAQQAGTVSAIEAAAWLDDTEWASPAGHLPGAPAGVVVAGRKPIVVVDRSRCAGQPGQLVSQGSC